MSNALDTLNANPHETNARTAKVKRVVDALLAGNEANLGLLEATATALADAGPIGAAFAEAVRARVNATLAAGETPIRPLSLTTRAEVAIALETYVNRARRVVASTCDDCEHCRRNGCDRHEARGDLRARARHVLDHTTGCDIEDVIATLRAQGEADLAEMVFAENEYRIGCTEDRDDG
jgi:hypothetical protein